MQVNFTASCITIWENCALKGVCHAKLKCMQTEGKATFHTGTTFFNAQAHHARDLGVLAAAVYRAARGQLRVIDAMAGCGVRSLRYTLESQADWVWVNDSNPQLQALLERNLSEALGRDRYQLTDWDANRVFFDCYLHQTFYDLVDVDCFGTTAPYLSTCLWAVTVGGLAYLTCTDSRSLTGHEAVSSLATYGAYPRNHPAMHEQSLRILIGQAQQLAATKGMGVEPIFSLFDGRAYRVMLRLVATVQLREANYGFLGYCHACGNYHPILWRRLGRESCPCGERLAMSGPLWLGPLHTVEQVNSMVELAQQWQWRQPVQRLQQMVAEADLPPYFYTLREMGRRGGLDLPPRSHLVAQLQSWGYRASVTSIHPQAIKTDADLQTCIRAAKAL